MLSLVYHRSGRNGELIEAVRRAAEDGITLHEALPAHVDWMLLEQQADAALASPLLYGQREGDLVLLPGASLTASGATADVFLHFREGLKTIATLGYYGEADINTMLAQVILKEKYGMAPRLSRLTQPPAEALTVVDALLLAQKEDAPAALPQSAIDLYDEWFDMTQLPFVREVFLAWEAMVTPEFAEAVRTAGEMLDDAALRQLEHHMEHERPEVETSTIPPHYRYRFTDDAGEGLRMFFQLAFFHGLHRDIPDFRIWEV
ncbi:MAG: hypothetical protein M5R41_01060 [Bacteroidia bacterium]|nr:hypothetical protein [Bacteroidia bacterium]